MLQPNVHLLGDQRILGGMQRSEDAAPLQIRAQPPSQSGSLPLFDGAPTREQVTIRTMESWYQQAEGTKRVIEQEAQHAQRPTRHDRVVQEVKPPGLERTQVVPQHQRGHIFGQHQRNVPDVPPAHVHEPYLKLEQRKHVHVGEKQVEEVALELFVQPHLVHDAGDHQKIVVGHQHPEVQWEKHVERGQCQHAHQQKHYPAEKQDRLAYHIVLLEPHDRLAPGGSSTVSRSLKLTLRPDGRAFEPPRSTVSGGPLNSCSLSSSVKLTYGSWCAFDCCRSKLNAPTLSVFRGLCSAAGTATRSFAVDSRSPSLP
uniref:Uncharacterized protein n=1 Tax=Anopheles coluzzii TaxID=1518534 RepID=A0A8W7PT40_ANOCL